MKVKVLSVDRRVTVESEGCEALGIEGWALDSFRVTVPIGSVPIDAQLWIEWEEDDD